MRKLFKYLFLVLLLAFAVVAIKEEIYKSDYGVFEDMAFGFNYLVLFILGSCTFFSWIKFYKKSKNRIAFLPMSIPVLLVIAIILINVMQQARKDTPVFLLAGEPELRLGLRVDSTYRIADYGDLGGDSYYGKFSLWNDTIFLDKPRSGLNISSKLVIRKIGYDRLFHTDIFILPVNQSGEVNDTTHRFPLIFDNRNKK